MRIVKVRMRRGQSPALPLLGLLFDFNGEDFAGEGFAGKRRRRKECVWGDDAKDDSDAQAQEMLAGLEVSGGLPLSAVVLNGNEIVRAQPGCAGGILEGEVEGGGIGTDGGNDGALDGRVKAGSGRSPALRDCGSLRGRRGALQAACVEELLFGGHLGLILFLAGEEFLKLAGMFEELGGGRAVLFGFGGGTGALRDALRFVHAFHRFGFAHRKAEQHAADAQLVIEGAGLEVDGVAGKTQGFVEAGVLRGVSEREHGVGGSEIRVELDGAAQVLLGGFEVADFLACAAMARA